MPSRCLLLQLPSGPASVLMSCTAKHLEDSSLGKPNGICAVDPNKCLLRVGESQAQGLGEPSRPLWCLGPFLVCTLTSHHLLPPTSSAFTCLDVSFHWGNAACLPGGREGRVRCRVQRFLTFVQLECSLMYKDKCRISPTFAFVGMDRSVLLSPLSF